MGVTFFAILLYLIALFTISRPPEIACDPSKSVARTDKTRFLIKKNSKYGFIDKEGNVKVKPIYEYPESADYFSENFAMVNIKDKWGFINENGVLKITLLGMRDGLFTGVGFKAGNAFVVNITENNPNFRSARQIINGFDSANDIEIQANFYLKSYKGLNFKNQ